jgi:hypothetical protein
MDGEGLFIELTRRKVDCRLKLLRGTID